MTVSDQATPPPPVETGRRANWGLVPLAWLAVLAATVVVGVVHGDRILQRFPDDAFFYIKTANNIARGLGPTFDGVSPTNGFHPLYLLLLSALARFVPLTGGGGVIAVYCLDAVLLLLGLLLVNRALAGLGLAESWRAAAVLAVGGFILPSFFGTEVRLSFALLWLYLWCLQSPWRGNLWGRAAVGGAAMLLCLARLEMVLYVGLVSLVALALPAWRDREWRRAGLALAWGMGPTLLAFAAYSAYNLSAFGHLTSVSSWLKVGFPGALRTGWWPHARWDVQMALLALFAGGVTLLILLGRWRRRGALDAAQERLQALGLASALFFVLYPLFMVLFSTLGPARWYFPAPLSLLAGAATVAAAYLLGASPGLAQRRSHRLGLVALALVLAILVPLDCRKLATLPTYQLAGRHLGEWIARNLPADARVFVSDDSGVVGYCSERAVINGDGLINNFEYQDYLRGGRLVEYLLRQKVGYVVCPQYPEGGNQTVAIPLFRDPQWLVCRLSPAAPLVKRSGHLFLYACRPPVLAQTRLQTVTSRAALSEFLARRAHRQPEASGGD